MGAVGHADRHRNDHKSITVLVVKVILVISDTKYVYTALVILGKQKVKYHIITVERRKFAKFDITQLLNN